jgi:hypothetical protein
MSAADDDETTSTRAKKPRTPMLPAETTETAPQRPTVPLIGRGSARRGATDDFGERPDDAPTMFDPDVPTGARGPTEDERRTNQGPAQPDPFPDLDDSELPSGATVIGKRSAGAPRVLPVDTADLTNKANPRFRPHAPNDDLIRTTKWEPPQVDAEPTGPALRPPPAPQLPLPPVLPLSPGPRSEPIHVMSMKTPAGAEADKQQRPLPEVRMRAMAEVRPNQTPPLGMGFLAPPRDAKQARSRRWRDNVIWGSVAVIVAAVVMLAVWFIAR